jgi:acetylserotonin N-methyltransferase
MYDVPTTSDRHIWDLWLTQTYQGAMLAADDAGVFAALHERPSSIPELAARLDLDERATGILLRHLASLGLLVPRDERFQLTDVSRLYLLKSSPYYWGPMMRVGASEWHHKTLVAALKRKDSANAAGPEGIPQASGSGRSADAWAEGNISGEEALKVARRMHAHSLVPAVAAARSYDFTGVRRILDVGGGSGCFMIAIAQQHPAIQCTIMELPAMCDVAQSYIQAEGVADRVGTLAVDMFRQPWPKGYDAVFFSNVWHDWNFRTCAWLARRTYEALPRGGRILLHEMLLDDDGAGPPAAASLSMLMLLATQGQQFTFNELRKILEDAGFGRVQAQHNVGYYSITTGYKD